MSRLTRAIMFVLALLVLVLLALVITARGGHSRTRYGGAYGDLTSDNGDDDGDDGEYGDESDYLGGCGGIDGGAEIRLRMRDPAYTQALEGKKTVEGRLDRPPLSRLKAGDAFTVARSRARDDTVEYPGARRFSAKVSHVKKYPTYDRLLEGEGLKAVAPGAKSAAAATAAFREFTDEAAEKEHGLIAIGFERKN